MIEYKYQRVKGLSEKKFLENGHTMFEEDVLQRLKRLAYLEEQIKQGQLLPIDSVSISLPDYEYEMLIDDKGTPFEINSWIPIATDRIKDPSRIDEYIAKGLIRKRQ